VTLAVDGTVVETATGFVIGPRFGVAVWVAVTAADKVRDANCMDVAGAPVFDTQDVGLLV
jgi:hypothetical protein